MAILNFRNFYIVYVGTEAQEFLDLQDALKFWNK